MARKKLNFTWTTLWPVLALIIIGIGLYWPLLNGYFATDEWWAFSFAIACNGLLDALTPSGVYTPLGNLFIYGLYHGFGVNPVVWASLTILFHILNTLLLYWLVCRLSQRQMVGLAAAALFSVMPMGLQFLTQFSLLPTSGIGTTLALSSLVAVTYRRPWLTAGLYLLSLSFTAYTVPTILLIGLTELTLFQRSSWRQSLSTLVTATGAIGLYLVVQRYTALHSPRIYDRPLETDGGSLVERLLSVGQKLWQSYGEMILFQPGHIESATMIRASAWIVGLTLVITLLFAIRRQWVMAKLLLFGLLWIPASLTLFSTLNTVTVDTTYASRYLYLAVAGLAIMFATASFGIFDFYFRKLPIGKVIASLITLGLIFYYFPQSRNIVVGDVAYGQKRQMIMNKITTDVSKPLPYHALFCFTSNTSHYSDKPDRIPLPFVHNFSFNLAVTYRAEDQLFREFFDEGGIFLNPAASFYYYRRDDKGEIGPGLGFATNIPECRRIKEGNSFIASDMVFGFAYDGRERRIINISVPLRAFLAGDTEVEDQLYPWPKYIQTDKGPVENIYND